MVGSLVVDNSKLSRSPLAAKNGVRQVMCSNGWMVSSAVSEGDRGVLLLCP